MLINEAEWFSKELIKIKNNDLFPMLNIGSANEFFRKTSQPWINKYLFEKYEIRNTKKIWHLDSKEFGKKSGVDIILDIQINDFEKHLPNIKFKSIMCTNILEHIENIEVICEKLIELLPQNGFLFVSCPYKYPYHPEPIDTMLRPDVSELYSYFNKLKLIKGNIVSEVFHLQRFFLFPKTTLKNFINKILFFRKKEKEYKPNYFKWIFKRFKVTCLVLQKK